MLTNFVIVLINRWKVTFFRWKVFFSTFFNTDICKLLRSFKISKDSFLHWDRVEHIKDPQFQIVASFFQPVNPEFFLTITCLFEKATNAFSTYMGTWIILFIGKHSHSLDPFTPKISSVILLTVCHTILMM